MDLIPERAATGAGSGNGGGVVSFGVGWWYLIAHAMLCHALPCPRSNREAADDARFSTRQRAVHCQPRTPDMCQLCRKITKVKFTYLLLKSEAIPSICAGGLSDAEIR
jgi:hypothetical protein